MKRTPTETWPNHQAAIILLHLHNSYYGTYIYIQIGTGVPGHGDTGGDEIWGCSMKFA
jgi:hypothetical protein